jgi:hypothetical protein
MPTAKAFAAVPAFPDDIPVYVLPKVSLNKLNANDEEESKALFETFREHGFALLDLQGCEQGEKLLEEAEHMFKVTEDVTIGLDFEEKMKYAVQLPSIFGYELYLPRNYPRNYWNLITDSKQLLQTRQHKSRVWPPRSL